MSHVTTLPSEVVGTLIATPISGKAKTSGRLLISEQGPCLHMYVGHGQILHRPKRSFPT